jgi:hypothetical protein
MNVEEFRRAYESSEPGRRGGVLEGGRVPVRRRNAVRPREAVLAPLQRAGVSHRRSAVRSWERPPGHSEALVLRGQAREKLPPNEGEDE